MLFNSLSYAIFFPIVFIVNWLLPNKYRWILLLMASYYFYMSWNPKYVILILGTTAISYLAGIKLEKAKNENEKKLILLISIAVCLGVLFVFKYFNFTMQSINFVLGLFAIKLNPITLKLLLPVGISFYTFQTLSYVVDVYREKIPAEKHFGYYATFISFFPQLVAGPIERTSNLLPQIKSDHEFNYNQAVYGMRQMLFGFFKKIVLADNLAVFVDRIYNNVESYSGFAFVIATFFFAIQIYCDFSGYSDIAIGSSKLLGINLMTNFKSPYLSSSVKEFWSRWHISLSTWFKDYVYIPLGGNRCSKIRHKFNLFITFILSGLWHGASWNFVIWGALHGVAQMFSIRKVYKNKIIYITKILSTFVFCCLTWIFFRANSLKDVLFIFTHALDSIENLFNYIYSGFVAIDITILKFVEIVISLITLLVVDVMSFNKDVYTLLDNKKRVYRWLIYAIITLMIIGFYPSNVVTQFIYFQF